MWTPYAGEPQQLFAGFVHPPTEVMMRDAFALRGLQNFATLKGLEGSCDLPLDRTSLMGLNRGNHWERLKLKCREYGLGGKNVPLPDSLEPLRDTLIATLHGKPTELQPSLIWNVAVCLWLLKAQPTLEEAIKLGQSLIRAGAPWDQLSALKTAFAAS